MAVVVAVAVIMVATRHVTVGMLVPVLVPMLMAALAFMRMRVIVAAAAMILFAQTADVLGGLPALGHLVHHVGLHTVATYREHRAAQECVHAGVFAQRADGEVGKHARDERDQHLQPQHAEQQPRVDPLGHQHGQHLIGRGEKHRHERAERHHATRVERGRHGRKATLRDHAQQRADNRSGSARAANHRVRTGARGMLERLERDVGHEQERHERKGVLERMLHEMQQQIHGRLSSTGISNGARRPEGSCLHTPCATWQTRDTRANQYTNSFLWITHNDRQHFTTINNLPDRSTAQSGDSCTRWFAVQPLGTSWCQ